MIQVQQGALGPFKQDLAALLVDLMQQPGHIGDQGRQLLGEPQGLLQGRAAVDGVRAVVMLEREVVELQQGQQPLLKTRRGQQIASAQGPPGRLVLIGGADAAPGGA